MTRIEVPDSAGDGAGTDGDTGHRLEILDRMTTALRDGLDGEVLTGRADIETYRNDRSGHRSTATGFAVVLAASVADVQLVCRLASRFGVPVIPRGAGTGYAGGAAALTGSIVLSLERLDRIIGIDRDSELCVVEPGVITAAVSAAAAEFGLRYAPDPASTAISTIGGNIATNAGGLCCVKYGVTRDSVLALDVVLANGDLVRTGHRSIKGVSGYDLTALMIGSEGTLGIVVGATVRLLPIPLGTVHTIAAYLPSTAAAARASLAVVRTNVRPAMLELVDRVHLERIDAWRGTALLARGAGVLLIQTDGLAAEAEAEAVVGALVAEGADIEVTTDAERSRELLAVRRWTSEESPDRREITLNEDIAVPRGRIVEMIDLVERVRIRRSVVITVLAHIGDGNLHANIRVPLDQLDPDGAVPADAWAAADDLITGAIALGGTISGEHGIGLLKRQWLRTELGEGQYRLQRSIKSALDPDGILNPGKVFIE